MIPESPTLLADTLLGMLRDPEARQSLSVEGREFVRHFNWEQEQERLLQVYGAVAGMGSTRNAGGVP